MEMAQPPAQNVNKITHQDINLKFGKERVVDFMFAQRERNWSCLRNPSITERSSARDSERVDIDGIRIEDLRDEDKE